jgi:transposase
MEFDLEDLEGTATEDEIDAEQAAARTTMVASFTRKRPARQPFPAHLPRERIVVPGPTACACCGGTRLRKLGETVTETLEVIPRQWKVIQHVREKMTCRDCEKISEPPAPFHVTPRGWAGANLLAMLLFEKFGQHQPLNRQAERYVREGAPLSLSTLADQVGRRLRSAEAAPGHPPGAERTPHRRSRSLDARREAKACARQRCCQGHGLRAQRWTAFTRFLDDGRVCLSNNAAERGQEIVTVRRLRSRRATRRRHVQPDHHGEDERHRSAGLARRRAHPHRWPPGLEARRVAAVELAHSGHNA